MDESLVCVVEEMSKFNDKYIERVRPRKEESESVCVRERKIIIEWECNSV